MTAARAAGAACLLVLACAAPPRRPSFTEADYPGLLRPATTLGREVLWQQRVTADWGEGRSRGFDAALQSRDGALTLVGLSPMGTTGFQIVLRGGEIDYRNTSGEELPFPPRFILLDVQRVFFPWLEAGAGEGVVGDERVVEQLEGGRLRERRFERLDGKPAGEIRVHYEWGQQEWAAPTRAVLENGWFGYTLTIETLGETRLQPQGTP